MHGRLLATRAYREDHPRIGFALPCDHTGRVPTSCWSTNLTQRQKSSIGLRSMGETIVIATEHMEQEIEYLEVRSDEKDWHIRIERSDNKTCTCFRRYCATPVSNSDIRRFLPNWDSLTWRSARLGSTRGVAAKDNQFQVWLLTAVTEEDLAEDQIIAEFETVMGNA